MPVKKLVVLPLLWGFAFLIPSILLLGSPAHPVFVKTAVELSKVLAVVGALAAVFSLAKGEYLRRAWTLIASSTLCFLIRDLTLAPIGFENLDPTHLLILRGVLVILGNLLMVIGVFMLARAWKLAELALPGKPRGRRAVLVIAILLALALAGPGVLKFGGQVLEGDLAAIPGASSSLGDTLVLMLIAPLLMTALALRGGTFAWPWALLTASTVCWLFYDAFWALGTDLGLSAGAARNAMEFFRALGCAYSASAGFAQRWIAKS